MPRYYLQYVMAIIDSLDRHCKDKNSGSVEEQIPCLEAPPVNCEIVPRKKNTRGMIQHLQSR